MSLPADNSQKTPLAAALQKLGRAKAQDAVAALPRNLPCTVASVQGPGVVTVNFAVDAAPTTISQMQIPVNKSPYIDYPIQVGDVGETLSADLRTGGLTGLGTGVPGLQDTVGNLAAMAFFPLGKTSETFLDKDALVLYKNFVCTPTQLSFFGGTKVSKQTVTGALSAVTDANAKTVLTSIIAALAAYGLVVNGTA